MDSPFHPGEQQIQSRLGVRDKLEEIGKRVIRDHMPEQHREFFALLPWLLVGSRDAAGQPQASVLWGAPGFVHSPQPQRLQIRALPEADDPLAANLHDGAGLGLLGIELPTRRRNRLNGRARHLDEGGFAVDVHESFGNCPKYIQVRRWQAEPREPGPLEQGEGLDPRWLPLALHSDTLFIASSHGEDVDVSHRGGPPGFVRLGTDGRLWLPDYSGNFMFNTLGNLLLEPRCALLWIDFASGDLLQLEARAELVWPEDYPEPAPPGAERMLALTPGRWRLRRARLPLAFGIAEPSPFLPVEGN
ncbi:MULTISPECIES: pyridoxamine 5'-phosphate oxidase family protein [unclassified Pseudomonas]|uniref:pyridoxamine 5'-phosphate oxidase family protein n=1 Tax=unclassified Pseudomonas TaxID=196821 RepID=UPI002447F5B5|nr:MULTISPECIES: pyridoxamine 5'-phosphate oxidase family protein [unclassified Pseudomonas]MDG9924747.1 pyridoxamine 5'-phosphate oxidase family protein [Pseudomonas sp. GD04045]MDH0036728.1 pyridoxamine 5'-phosphate oxidase family protein [Pseudomonas sp. GD04019]